MRSLKLQNKGVYCKGRYHKSQNYYTVLGSKRVDFWFLKMGRWGSLPRCFQFWSKMVQMGPTYLGLMGFCWNLSWPVLTFPANCDLSKLMWNKYDNFVVDISFKRRPNFSLWMITLSLTTVVVLTTCPIFPFICHP